MYTAQVSERRQKEGYYCHETRQHQMLQQRERIQTSHSMRQGGATVPQDAVYIQQKVVIKARESEARYGVLSMSVCRKDSDLQRDTEAVSRCIDSCSWEYLINLIYTRGEFLEF